MRSLGWLLLVAPLVAAVSCGLAGATGGGSGGSGGAASSSIASSTGAGGFGGRGASTSSTTSHASSGAAGGSTGPAGGGGAAVTSSSSSSTGGGGGGGAPACDPAAPGVCCPDATCGKKCCYTPGQGLDCQSARCGDFRLACDDSRDCSGGELCCANRAASGDWDSDFRCKTAVMGQCPGTRVEICKVGSDAMCQSGGSCVPSAQLGGEHGSCVP